MSCLSVITAIVSAVYLASVSSRTFASSCAYVLLFLSFMIF